MHALFEHFIEFMNYCDSIPTSHSFPLPAQTSVAAPVLTQAPAGPSEIANPPTVVPGPKLGFRSISGDPRPFRPEVNNPASTSLRCASVLDGALTRAGLKCSPLGALLVGDHRSAF